MKTQSIFRDAWYFYRSQFSSIAALCLPLLIIEAVVAHFWQQQSGQPLTLGELIIVGLLFSPLYTAALIYFLAARSQSTPSSYGGLLNDALRIWPAFALLTALSAVLRGLGMALFIVPGIWLSVRLSLAEYLLVLRNLPPIEAMRESFRLTEGRFWPLLVLMAVSMLLLPLLALGLLSPLVEPLGAYGPVVIAPIVGLVKLYGVIVLFRAFMLIDPARPAAPIDIHEDR